MRNEGYDIVFCDFVDGADWIQRNGLAFIEVMKAVNADKKMNNANICFPNLVIGASMGGQVAKWALRTMELQGENHDAALYASFDSPQRGANIALSIQSFLWFNATFGDAGSRAGVKPLWDALNRPAAQQLLVHHFNKIEQTNGCDLRALFAQEMTDLGYPRKTRNIGMSNGTGTGVGQGYASSALLADIQGGIKFLGISITGLDVKLSASGASTISDVTKVIDQGYTFTLVPPVYTKNITFAAMVVSLQNPSQIHVDVRK
jgi:hypothetical protein